MNAELNKEIKKRRQVFRDGIKEQLNLLFCDDDDAKLKALRMKFLNQKNAINTENDVIQFGHALLGGTSDLESIIERCSRCNNLTTLTLSDPSCNHSTQRALQRTHELLWPVEQGIYSGERCKNCNNKSIYHISKQVQNADEETSFFAVCAICSG